MKFEKLYFEDPKDLFLSIYYTIYVPDGKQKLIPVDTYIFCISFLFLKVVGRTVEVHCLGSQEFFPKVPGRGCNLESCF